jgi:hypothetical protein
MENLWESGTIHLAQILVRERDNRFSCGSSERRLIGVTYLRWWHEW